MQVGHLRTAAAVVAAVGLGASYVWLMVAHGTVWLGDAVVHENGRLTLAGTVGYVEHFLREWPVDVMSALCVAAVVQPFARGGAQHRRIASITATGAVLMAAVAAAVAIERSGWDLVRHDLLQSVTREGAFVFGSHWHSHFLPLVCLAMVATAFARRSALTLAAWGWLAAMTAIFGLGAETFSSARFLGHQLRELVTHVGVMVPVVTALVLAGADGATRVRWRLDSGAGVALGGAAVVALALATLSVTHGSTGHMQPGAGWSAVVAGHVFEHSLDYAWVALLTTTLVFWRTLRST